MNATKHVVLLTSNIFGRGFDSRRLHHVFYYQYITDVRIFQQAALSAPCDFSDVGSFCRIYIALNRHHFLVCNGSDCQQKPAGPAIID
jgi:hypothetical protein